MKIERLFNLSAYQVTNDLHMCVRACVCKLPNLSSCNRPMGIAITPHPYVSTGGIVFSRAILARSFGRHA